MKADKKKLGYTGAIPGSITRDSNAWFTPKKYTVLASDVMGQIDLDPFSSAAANESVQANRFFDEDLDAYKQVWFEDKGTVFMNPPYGRGLMEQSAKVFLDNLANKSISEGIVLVNNATETKWFQSLLIASNAVCFTSSRISFDNNDGKNKSANTRGQAFLYFGDNIEKFREVFGAIGSVLK